MAGFPFEGQRRHLDGAWGGGGLAYPNLFLVSEVSGAGANRPLSSRGAAERAVEAGAGGADRICGAWRAGRDVLGLGSAMLRAEFFANALALFSRQAFGSSPISSASCSRVYWL
jgi:hypothetical protein